MTTRRGLFIAFALWLWAIPLSAQAVYTPGCAPGEQYAPTYAEVMSGQPGVASYIRLFNPTGAAQEVWIRTYHADTGEMRQTSRVVLPLRSQVVPLWTLWPSPVIVSVMAIWSQGGATTVTQWTNNHTIAAEKVPTLVCRAYGPMGAS